MQLINQHTKRIMEGCKERAYDAGLRFHEETLEYIVTNRDLLELSPKVMIPTLYDYWVHDVEVLKEKGKYELYPSNPYETVINTRPAISFYNDNNPDWLNVMIFYHVIGHIDFFQNNHFFQHTWDYDFTGEALSDKRTIAKLRAEKGRWVDYAIEFAKGIDNIVNYHYELSRLNQSDNIKSSNRTDFYFDVFLQSVMKVPVYKYLKEIDKYNEYLSKYQSMVEDSFFSEVTKQYPEFEALFQKHLEEKSKGKKDLLQFIMDHSLFLKKEENQWIKTILQIVRKTSLFFQPQIRTKIMNEGWASYWHENLFLKDDRINGHEVDFARVNSFVTSMPRVGLNPYALGMRLFYYIEKMANEGKYSVEYSRLFDSHKRDNFDKKTGSGRDYIFTVRENMSDSMFVTMFIDQDFVDKHKIFVAGKRLNKAKMVWEYYIKSKNAKDYINMITDSLYHPPKISIDIEKSDNSSLYLIHHFEGKPLVKDYIPNTMMGIEYLWGGPVHFETSEVITNAQTQQVGQGSIKVYSSKPNEDKTAPSIKWRRVLYTMKNRKLSKKSL